MYPTKGVVPPGGAFVANGFCTHLRVLLPTKGAVPVKGALPERGAVKA